MIKTRTCIACRKKNLKENFMRIVLSKDGNPIVDELQKENTRGVYICKNNECINRLLKCKSLNKCLKIKADELSFKSLLEKLKD